MSLRTEAPIQGCFDDILKERRRVYQVDKSAFVKIAFGDYQRLRADNVNVRVVGYAQHPFRVDIVKDLKIEGLQGYQTCHGDTRLFWKGFGFSIPEGTRIGVNKEAVHSKRLPKTPLINSL